jgi:hypothetical protein
MTLAAMALPGCRSEAVEVSQTVSQTASEVVTGAVMELEGRNPKAAFEKYYEPTTVEVDAKAPQYSLPLDLEQVCNTPPPWMLSDEARAALIRNGFVVVDSGTQEDIVKIYSRAEDDGLPVFVTADTLLHLYHLQFDETLRAIEEREFHPAMVRFSRDMLRIAEQQFGDFEGDLKEAARRNAGFFSVALACLEGSAGEAPTAALDEVKAELELIEAHQGFAPSPIFKYKEDYSQYVPRGHYTKSETLKRYFKGLMWYGRIAMLLKGGTLALEDPHDATIQTLQGSLIAQTLYDPANAGLLATWQRLYSVTAFYVGVADDLTPYEYAQAIAKVAGASFEWAELASEQGLHDLKSELATYRSPKIYGGTGEAELLPPFSAEQLADLLSDTKGFRLMGQRYIPDSHMMQQLAFPAAGPFTGEGKPYTMEVTGAGPQRCFVRGLDIMATLGSERALEILQTEGDTAYANYDAQLATLRAEFEALTPAEWNRNLYFSWLYALRALIASPAEGRPTFMTTQAYRDRSLWAALASWAQLRHDTILYAKQTYVPVGMAAPMPKPEPPPGYIEPLPEFYARMLALAKMTRAGLADMDVLDEPATERLRNLEEIIGNMLRISLIELRGEELGEEDVSYIKGIAWRLKRCVEGLADGDDKTTIVADVITDTNTGQVQEEGVGYVKRMLVAYGLPDGRIAIGTGPALSCYEFKWPMSDRLTDEKWREMLKADAPDAPAWTGSFYVPDADR